MGRSVSYPSGAIVAFTVLEVEDENDWEFEYEWLQGDLRERAAAAFPSLQPHEGWRGREDRILMRNMFTNFGVSVYGGLVAVWIVERDDGAYWDSEWRTARAALANPDRAAFRRAVRHPRLPRSYVERREHIPQAGSLTRQRRRATVHAGGPCWRL